MTVRSCPLGHKVLYFVKNILELQNEILYSGLILHYLRHCKSMHCGMILIFCKKKSSQILLFLENLWIIKIYITFASPKGELALHSISWSSKNIGFSSGRCGVRFAYKVCALIVLTPQRRVNEQKKCT